jgi:pimeloyl-ACP methyl ester carboxylesterase
MQPEICRKENANFEFRIDRSMGKKIFRIFGWFMLFLGLGICLFCLAFYRRPIPLAVLKAKYTNDQSKFLPLLGMWIHYRDEGNMADSTPLVLIHGISSSLQTWDSLTCYLRSKKRIIRFDLPGFGLTGPDPEADYSFSYYARFLDSLLNHLQVSKCDIAGNSLGGGIAWQYASDHPKKVAKLILIDATGYPFIYSKLALGLKLLSNPLMSALAKSITPKFVTRKVLEDVYADQSKITQPLVNRYYDLSLREGNRQALIQRVKEGFDQDSSRIRQLDMPVLILWGEQDKMIPLKNAFLFHEAIRGSTLDILKGVGHVPTEESPGPASALIETFLNK